MAKILEHEQIAERMRLTFELCSFAEAMLRQRHRRTNPHATAESIERAIEDWRTRGLRRPEGASEWIYPLEEREP